MKTLILYQFHEICENLVFFIKNGLFESQDHTFVIVCNGYNMTIKDKIWEELEKYSNVKLMLRKNIGLDFEAWNSVLFLDYNLFKQSERFFFQVDCESTNLDQLLYQCYDKFIFLNSTVFGPCLPSYAKGMWPDYFTSNLNETIYLVGVTISCAPKPWDIITPISKFYNFIPTNSCHIQSMCFGMHKKALDLLITYGLFAKDKDFPKDKIKLIITSEIAMSVILKKEGYSIYSLLVGQGEMKSDNHTFYNHIWWAPRTNLPLIETIFTKTNTGKEYLEKDRYIKTFSGRKHEIVF